MDIQVFEPAVSPYFAGNPIVVRVTTDKTLDVGESFLRIVCSASYRVAEHTYIPELEVEYSQPIANKGEATFNLADGAQSMVNRVQAEIDMNLVLPSGSNTADPKYQRLWYHPVNVVCTYSCKVVWIEDNVEVSLSGYESGKYSMNIVPGRFTDFELFTKDTIGLSALVDKKPMTRKPDLGMVYKGETVIVPMVSTQSRQPSITATIGSKTINGGSHYLSSYALDYSYMTLSEDADGDITVSSSYVGSLSGHYRTNTQGVQFLRFINGFGAVENIAVRSKDKLSYEVSGDTHSLVQGIETRPTDRRYATKTQPVGVYELSSGYVPQKWAEWFVQELLTSPRVWILLGGKWVPALIEAEDDCVIYDRTKPEMPHVDFTLRLAIDGVCGITW